MRLAADNELWRATFNVKIGKKRWLLWGYQGFHDLAGACGLPGDSAIPGETSSRPVWVRCEDVDSEVRCNDWTVSTFDLRDDPTADPALACMVEVEKGVPTPKHQDVEANFTIRLKYLPDGVACPPAGWPVPPKP